jgi:NADH-quinone oxidoreductase subunit J
VVKSLASLWSFWSLTTHHSSEIDTMDLTIFLFWAIALLTAGCAVAVVVTQNIVRAATWLLFALGGTAAVFFLLGADFVGATQLLVYVGGTLVLVIFGVMLTAQGPFISMKTGAADWAIAMVVGLLLYCVIAFAVIVSHVSEHFPHQTPGGDPAVVTNSEALGESLLGVRTATAEKNVTGTPANKTIPRTRMSYLMPFEIVSVHLLVVLIGAAYLARAKRRQRTPVAETGAAA